MRKTVFAIIIFIYFLFISTTHAAGTLVVDSITPINTSAHADNTFTNGWKWIFNITVPDTEAVFKMKFDDFKTATTTIPTAGNVRISSEQSTNAKSASPVTLSSANVYSDTLTIASTTDLNGTKEGTQIQVTVEVRVPVGTASGAYTASYGVSSKIVNEPFLKLTSPKGGETMASGSSGNVITWEAENVIGKFTINIVSKDNVSVQAHIMETDIDKRSATFIMPIMPAGDYKMYILATNVPVSYSEGYFHITSTPEQEMTILTYPKVQVVSPNGGETIKAGESIVVRWIASLVTGKISISMRNEDQSVFAGFQLAQDIDARDGSLTFPISQSIVLGKYKVVIITPGGGTSDESDGTITIVGP